MKALAVASYSLSMSKSNSDCELQSCSCFPFLLPNRWIFDFFWFLFIYSFVLCHPIPILYHLTPAQIPRYTCLLVICIAIRSLVFVLDFFCSKSPYVICVHKTLLGYSTLVGSDESTYPFFSYFNNYLTRDKTSPEIKNIWVQLSNLPETLSYSMCERGILFLASQRYWED